MRKINLKCTCKDKSDTNIENKNKKYDLDMILWTLNRDVGKLPVRYCAKYVRRALATGGIIIPFTSEEIKNEQTNAKDYGKPLERLGFYEVKSEDYKIGDITVITKGPWGHIQIYNGVRWLADFYQRGFSYGPTVTKKEYKVYRYDFK